MARAMRQPMSSGLPSLFGNLELNRPPRLLLKDSGTPPRASSRQDVSKAQSNHVTASKLAVDRQVEKGEIPDALFNLDPHPDGPDMHRPERKLCP
jgi:hypothetical protein